MHYRNKGPPPDMTKMKMAFINREKEIRELRNYLQTPANSILFLHGPKSSGKTTLTYRLFEPIETEKGYDINFLNLREIFLTSYDDFISIFFKSTDADNGLKNRHQKTVQPVWSL